MHTYWAQVFLLPKKITELVTSICRTFLWAGSGEASRKAPIACDKVCLPRLVRGLNIIDVYKWNKEAICKLLWVLDEEKDTLWIQWVRNFYIKDKDQTELQTPSQASWIVRKSFDARKTCKR